MSSWSGVQTVLFAVFRVAVYIVFNFFVFVVFVRFCLSLWPDSLKQTTAASDELSEFLLVGFYE